jgi:hypothetical protein
MGPHIERGNVVTPLRKSRPAGTQRDSFSKKELDFHMTVSAV